ncbi:MAG: tRNA/rRNA methyltransferase [Bacteroidota bacterium]
MKTAFILVEPAVPENIGAAARAIKVMGFNQLWLINPSNHLADPAKWLAHGSTEILEQAKIFTSLEQAAAEVDYLVATTAKKRASHIEYIDGNILGKTLETKSNLIQTAGIVFGREESGLSKSEMMLCDAVSYLPMATTYPSLNLSQAVMLYAYLLSQNKATKISAKPEKPETHSEGFRKMKSNLLEIIKAIGITEKHPIFGRISQRLASASEKDMRLLHSVAEKLKANLNRTDE